MKLTLRIENFDYLPDGGPLEVTVTGRGCEVGRDSAMDWTLPDPNRHISSRHFEVLLRDGKFLLNDISTNGTFVYGQSMRVSSPHQLSHNDRLQVGNYIIRVLIEGPGQPAPLFAPPAAAPPPLFAPPQAPTQAHDPWAMVPTPTPMPAPSRGVMPLAGQYGDSLVDMPRAPSPPPPAPAPVPQPGFVAPPAAQSAPFQPARAPTNPPAQVETPPAVPASGATDDLLEAICRGAGLPPGSLSKSDPAQIGEEIGKCLRIATQELMQLLGARAQAKQMVKSGSRTMIGGLNNSPLKFKPNATEALMSMFVQRPESYLDSTASLQQGFDDIRRHQLALMAAIQPALANLLDGLSPESIEERTTAGLMSSKKTRAWETFVERWDAKTHPHEHGMLTVFLNYYADAYDVALKKIEG
ncbi:MAG: type VI secretion system-associated FHA domain protein TagH [Paracoccaceae bacterium]